VGAGQETAGSVLGWLARLRPRDAARAWPPRGGALTFVASLLGAISSAVERRRLFVLLPFALIAGLVVYAGLMSEPAAYWLFAGGAAAIAILAGALWSRSLLWLRLGIQFTAFWLGLSLLPIHGALFGTTMLDYPAYGTYVATVDEVLSADDQEQRIIISHIEPQPDARPVDLRRARLLLPSTIELEPGDRISGRLRLAPIPGPILPGAFDGQFHAYFIGVGAYGSAIGDIERVHESDEWSLVRMVQSLRRHIGQRIDAVLEGDTAAIGKAMVVGDQSAITDETREVMAASGLAHIYSISGLHLSIVAGGIFWLVRLALASVPALVGWPVKQIAAMAGLVAAFLYLLLAGGVDNVPAFRSTLMLALIFGAVLAGRQALTMRNVAIAAMLIILIDPASVFRASFQLSFAAVVGLIGIYELPHRPAAPGKGSAGRLGRVLLTTAWTSLVAGLATLLFSAYHFQQTAPLGVLGNLLALPVVSLVIMPFGVVSVLAMPLSLEALPLQVMGWGIDWMVRIAELVAAWSEGLTGNPLLAGWTLIAGLCALAWFALIETRWRFLGPALALPIIAVFGFEPRPDVIIADTTQAVAISDGETLALASGRTGSFAVDVWGQHYQTKIAQTHSGAHCDSLGCIVTTPEFSVAVVRNAAAFAEDCGHHDLLIARVYPPSGCFEAGTVIGPRELARGGVHWLAWNDQRRAFDIRTAIPSLDRPWRPQ
jgi:competence protein ComEC